ncbi:MAG: M28 family peptidase [Alcanivoracaceae bacterium]|nr:M28 family peptidase [Alcanivoracaceae bacterium]MBL4773580.1 M28 family peptidase [Alcanivoracaceae bacterium]
MQTIRNKLLKTAIRIILLLLAMFIIIAILVTQPVFSKRHPQQAISSIANLKKHVYMLSETIPQKTAMANLLDVKAEYIFEQLSQFGDKVSYQYYDVMGDTHKNIIVEYSGSNNNCGTYVIGAHYDTYSGFAGADDNSSGVAGIIELTNLFAQSQPACDIQLVAYTLEEPPYFRSEHMGSFVHAQSLKNNDVNVELMLSLEMIGYFSDEENSQDYPVKGMKHLYSDKGNFISLVGNLSQIGLTRFFKKSMRSSTDLPVYSINAPSMVTGIDFSDHLNYWQFDYPAIMVSDTAFNRNKNYHSQDDTADKLDYNRMAKVVDGVYYALLQHMEN